MRGVRRRPRPSRRRGAEELDIRVAHDRIAWVDPARLLVHLCSRRDCGRLWHHLSPAALPSLGDPHLSMPHRRWHPCPWCVADDLAAATAEHDAVRRGLIDLSEWESELRTR